MTPLIMKSCCEYCEKWPHYNEPCCIEKEKQDNMPRYQSQVAVIGPGGDDEAVILNQ